VKIAETYLRSRARLGMTRGLYGGPSAPARLVASLTPNCPGGSAVALLRRPLSALLNERSDPYPILALVGYTNAGKSMLFNRMTPGALPNSPISLPSARWRMFRPRKGGWARAE
jgi:hypothetical protein